MVKTGPPPIIEALLRKGMSMTVTDKQMQANRANAKKSTGPKSKEGKKISSRNGIIHGLYAKDFIVNSPAFKENQADYDLILSGLAEELQPQGVLQEYLVRKIANCLWRSGRVVRAETAQICRQLKFMGDSLPRPMAVGLDSIPGGDASINILRYEMRVDRQLTRTFNLLMRLKKFQSSQTEDMEIVGPPNTDEANPISPPPDDDIPLPGT